MYRAKKWNELYKKILKIGILQNCYIKAFKFKLSIFK